MNRPSAEKPMDVEAYAVMFATAFENAILAMVAKDYIERTGLNVEDVLTKTHSAMFQEMRHHFPSEKEFDAKAAEILERGKELIRKRLWLREILSETKK